MKSVNSVQLLGNVGLVGELKIFETGNLITFTLATSEGGYTRKDGTTVPERTTWHTIVVSGAMTDVVQRYIHKGSKVYVSGRISVREYAASDGSKRKVTEIRANDLVLCGGGETRATGEYVPPVFSTQAPKPQDNDEIPF